MPNASEPPKTAELSLIRTNDEGLLEVQLAGELDMTAAFKIEPEAERLLAGHGVRRFLVDLSTVTFVDSAGLGTLLAMRQRSQDLGIEFALANASAPVRRMLVLSGTSSMLAD